MFAKILLFFAFAWAWIKYISWLFLWLFPIWLLFVYTAFDVACFIFQSFNTAFTRNSQGHRFFGSKRWAYALAIFLWKYTKWVGTALYILFLVCLWFDVPLLMSGWGWDWARKAAEAEAADPMALYAKMEWTSAHDAILEKIRNMK